MFTESICKICGCLIAKAAYGADQNEYTKKHMEWHRRITQLETAVMILERAVDTRTKVSISSGYAYKDLNKI